MRERKRLLAMFLATTMTLSNSGVYVIASDLTAEEGDFQDTVAVQENWGGTISSEEDPDFSEELALEDEYDGEDFALSDELLEDELGVVISNELPDVINEDDGSDPTLLEESGEDIILDLADDNEEGTFYTVTWDASGGYLKYWGEDYEGNWVEQTGVQYADKKAEGEEVFKFTDVFTNDPDKMFVGWALDPEAKEPVSFWDENDDPVYYADRNYTFYAVWKKAYTITWNANGGYLKYQGKDADGNWGDQTGVQYVDKKAEGEEIYEFTDAFANNPDKMFVGWALDPEAEEPVSFWDNDGDSIYYANQNYNFYAVWKKPFTITWDANGGYLEYWGRDVEGNWGDQTTNRYTEMKAEGKGISFFGKALTNEPDKIFIGWALEADADEPVSFGDNENDQYTFHAVRDYTFYAVWKEAYTITWDANGGYLEYYGQDDKGNWGDQIGSRYVEKKPEGEGIYEFNNVSTNGPDQMFVGWALDPRADEPISFWNSDDDEYALHADKDYTFYAVWKKTYTITWDANGGYLKYWGKNDKGDWGEQTSSEYVMQEAEGEEISIFGEALTDDADKIYVGWALDPKADEPVSFWNEDDESMFTADRAYTFYAVWKKAYSITWDLNGGYFANKVYDDETGEEKWIKPTSCTEKIVEGSRIYDEIDEFYNDEQDVIFTGWALSPDATEAFDLEDVEFYANKNYKFYAVWKNQVTITWDANGGYFEDENYDAEQDEWVPVKVSSRSDSQEEGNVIYSGDYPLPDDEKLVCVGWALQDDADQPVDFWDDNRDDWAFHASKNYTFYAVWKEAATITWDANGGYLEVEEYDAEEDEWVWTHLSSINSQEGVGTAVKNYYAAYNNTAGLHLAGWAESPSATEVIDFSEYVVQKSTTFYAIWVMRTASPSEGIASPSEGTPTPSKDPVAPSKEDASPSKNTGSSSAGTSTAGTGASAGTTGTKTTPVHTHSYGSWVVTKEATVLSQGEETRTCSCGAKETRATAKLTPTISLSFTSTLPMKTSQTAKKVVNITDLARGDSVVSVKSSNMKVVKASLSGNAITLKAQKKAGTATITVTLASKKAATFKVKVQKTAVKTKKIQVVSKKISLKKGKSVNLEAVLTPLTSQQKITYTTSNKKIATVSKKGVIKAKKAGKATITVKSGSKKVKVKVTVTK